MSYVSLVVGARPNFMKAEPVLRALREEGVSTQLVHTGQHYDDNMSDVFFRELGLPTPDVNLEVGSNTHARQTAQIMMAYEELCLSHRPEWTVVFGDVNSTVACSLVAAKLGIKVCHVEAGLRSRDWEMPEEINRVVTDRLSNLLLTPSPDADENLKREGVAAHQIRLVGNVMIDTLFRLLPAAKERTVLGDLGLETGGYAVVTLHRPSNVDDRDVLSGLVAGLQEVASRIPVVLPLHPRTKKMMLDFGVYESFVETPGVVVTEPLGYLDFLSLSSSAMLVVTDSGGLQEETTALGIPCITVRENTERPITITEGTNVIIGSSREKLVQQVSEILDSGGVEQRCPDLWDGKAGPRCAQEIIGYV